MLFISIVAGKTSYKLGVPTLLLFLLIGMLSGSEGIGGIQFDNSRVAQFVGIVSLNFILFSGGLDTDWKSIKPVLWVGVSLSTLGVLITALSVGLLVYWLTDFTLYEGFLLGAIVSSTDAAAVFSILRSKSLALKANLRPTLELESGSNDPMAYVLVIAFLSLVVNPEMSFWSIIPLFLQQMLIGATMGFLMALLSKWVINRIQLDFEGLYPVLVVALMFGTFSITDYSGGNGFLAVYITAVFLGNQELIHKKTILKVFDGFAWLMQIVLFLILGLLVNPSEVVPYVGIGLVLSFGLILFARPLAVFISLIPFRMKNRRRWYISWVGLRGAVPIVFATYPLLAGIEQANMIFNLVFFISVSSVIIQGTTLGYFARLFHVSLPEKVKRVTDIDALWSNRPKTNLKEIRLHKGNRVIGKKIVDLAFPKTALIVLIERNNEYITPNGNTVLEEDDLLHVIANHADALQQVFDCLQTGENMQ